MAVVRWAALAVLPAIIAPGCGSAVPPPARSAVATGYVLRLDDLPSAGFTVVEAAHRIDAGAVAPAGVSAATLRGDGLVDAARARYLLPAPELATANGPLDVISLVERFGSTSGAAAAYASEVAALDHVAGAELLSTGPLGDAGHATIEAASVPTGITAVQVTLEWRSGALVNRLLVRGRQGATGLGDALILGRRQLAREPG